MRALLVEDNSYVCKDVVTALTTAGFLVDVSHDGEDAWFKGDTEDYDVVVLDLGLPLLDGISVLRRWRETDRTFPVLILSARGNWTDKVECIEIGADDYLTKPFEAGELVARTRALVRRAAGYARPLLQVGRISIDTRRLTAQIDGIPARLSPLEFRFFDYLVHHPDRPISAGELAEHLYGSSGDSSDVNAIEALVLRLRRKHGADIVGTRRGFGYFLVAPES